MSDEKPATKKRTRKKRVVKKKEEPKPSSSCVECVALRDINLRCGSVIYVERKGNRFPVNLKYYDTLVAAKLVQKV